MMSALSGMTGFARTTGENEGHSWVWEMRSVNGKGLDIRLRLPNGFEALDQLVKTKIARMFKRGNMQVSLALQSQFSGKSYLVDEAFLDRLVDVNQRKGGPIDVSKLMAVPGVVIESAARLDEGAQKSLEAAMLESFDGVAAKLKSARDAEGAALLPIMSEALEEIEGLTAKASKLASTQPKAIQERVSRKFSELLADDVADDRLAQEAALMAMKADVREELDRLRAHCVQGQILLAAGSPVGRKLDFLAQEFNRETNTLCSKSSDIDLTQTGLALKSIIEQFREQAANVE